MSFRIIDPEFSATPLIGVAALNVKFTNLSVTYDIIVETGESSNFIVETGVSEDFIIEEGS
jgi:hypothetical protein